MPDTLFTGPAGRLEGRYSPGRSPIAPIALVLHAHPQYGGTMNTKLVYSLFNSFAQRDFATLRFNFRGVGRSQGSYDGGEGELSDAAAALDWLQTANPNARSVWVAGFSFGAWIAMQLLMRRPEIDGFVSVAPPAGRLDFNFLTPCPASGLIVQGGRDDIAEETSTAALVQKLSRQKEVMIDYQVIPEAGHFFSDHFQDMESAVGGYLDRVLRMPTALAASA
ncbi:MAG: alpha/beta hydrolase [Alphaproteobacteria bacterium]|nr:MAG: alpha/beta hydrolase [Alphaproteobacteria bacterium]